MDSIVIIAIRVAAVVAIDRIVQLLCEVLAPINKINTIMVILQGGRQLFAVCGRPEILFLSYNVAFAMIAFAFNNCWTRPRPRSTVILPLSIFQALILGYGCSFLWMAHVAFVLRHFFCDSSECTIFYASAAVAFIVFIQLWLGIAYLILCIASDFDFAPSWLSLTPSPVTSPTPVLSSYALFQEGMRLRQSLPREPQAQQARRIQKEGTPDTQITSQHFKERATNVSQAPSVPLPSSPTKETVSVSAGSKSKSSSVESPAGPLSKDRSKQLDAHCQRSNSASGVDSYKDVGTKSTSSTKVEVNNDDLWESVRQKNSKKDRTMESASDCKSEAQSVAPSVITAIWAPMHSSHPYMLGNRGPARTSNAVIATMIARKTAEQGHEDKSGYMSETSSTVTVKPFPRQSPLSG